MLVHYSPSTPGPPDILLPLALHPLGHSGIYDGGKGLPEGGGIHSHPGLSLSR